MQERIIQDMTGLLEGISVLCGSISEHSDWNLLVLEIVAAVLCDWDPVVVATGQSNHGLVVEKRRPLGHTRHPRFGGCLAVGGMISTNTRPELERVLGSVDAGKKQKRVKKTEEVGLRVKVFQTGQGIFLLNKGEKQYECLLKEYCKVESMVNIANTELLSSVQKDFDAERDKVKANHFSLFFALIAFCCNYVSHTQAFDTLTQALTPRTLLFTVRKLNSFIDEKNKRDLCIALHSLVAMLSCVNSMADHDQYKRYSLLIQAFLFTNTELSFTKKPYSPFF